MTREAHVDLPSGLSLTADEAGAITRAKDTTIVAIVAPFEAGKTTLLAELYQGFSGGVFSDLSFSGSASLLGFEERMFLARVASLRPSPGTPRTPRGDRSFLHLRVARAGLRRDLLLADWPGEAFEEIRDAPATVERYPVLGRADCIAFLVDGRKLADLKERPAVLFEADLLIRAFLQGGVLDGKTIQVVYTKWDVACGSGDESTLQTALSAFETGVRGLVGDAGQELKFVRTSARPESGSGVAPALGLDELLHLWIDAAPAGNVPVFVTDPETHRQFDRFGR